MKQSVCAGVGRMEKEVEKKLRMSRYRYMRDLGDGTHGSVKLYRSTVTGRLVAIKKMKKEFKTWEECMQLNEVRCLKELCTYAHPNVITCEEVIKENNHLYLVFEHMEDNLCSLIDKRKQHGEPFPEAKIRSVIYQVLKGLAFLHEHGIFHRDLKPENLLYTTETVKITDFGLGRPVGSGPPYTEYISTRWYRAPEALLKNGVYGPSIDVWAVGVIMAEMYLLRPLFPGTSELNQMKSICSVLGTPGEEEWPDGSRIRAVFPAMQSVPLSGIMPQASTEAIHLLQAMLRWNPCDRPSAEEALKYPYFELALQLQLAVPRGRFEE